MSRIMDGLGYGDRRKISTLVVAILAFTSFSFVQGTIIQQLMDLHLPAWPIVSIRNFIAGIGIVISIAIAKNWF